MKETSIAKTLKQLKTIFILNLTFLVLLVPIIYYFRSHTTMEVVGLQRWMILITMVAVPLALKGFQWQFDKIVNTQNIGKYKQIYLLRLFAISALCIINTLATYFTGVQNFIFLAIIVIFALFLCVPSTEQLKRIHKIENETNEAE